MRSDASGLLARSLAPRPPRPRQAFGPDRLEKLLSIDAAGDLTGAEVVEKFIERAAENHGVFIEVFKVGTTPLSSAAGRRVPPPGPSD